MSSRYCSRNGANVKLARQREKFPVQRAGGGGLVRRLNLGLVEWVTSLLRGLVKSQVPTKSWRSAMLLLTLIGATAGGQSAWASNICYENCGETTTPTTAEAYKQCRAECMEKVYDSDSNHPKLQYMSCVWTKCLPNVVIKVGTVVAEVVNAVVSTYTSLKTAGILRSGRRASTDTTVEDIVKMLWWYKPKQLHYSSVRVSSDVPLTQDIMVDDNSHAPLIFALSKYDWNASKLNSKLVITTPSGQELNPSSPQVIALYKEDVMNEETGDIDDIGFYLINGAETGKWNVKVVSEANEKEYIDLVVAANDRSQPPTEDADGDKLPDEWEDWYFPNNHYLEAVNEYYRSTKDADGDGVIDLDEYQAGTDPTNGNNGASIEGVVWNDTNLNGMKDEGEGLPDYGVVLTFAVMNGRGGTYDYWLNTKTDKDGHYKFSGLYLDGTTPTTYGYMNDGRFTVSVEKGIWIPTTPETIVIKELNPFQALTGVDFPKMTTSYPLTVTKTGNGTITSTPAGISCDTDCTEDYALNTQVTLTATADSGSTFAGWGGSCSGTGTCQVTMSQAQNVTATFNQQVVLCPNAICNVAKTGSDTTGDGSEAKPFATIQHGIDVAQTDYTVLVHSGTYMENTNFNGKKITVKSKEGVEKTVIDGNKKGSVVTFESGETPSTLLEGFTITNGSGTLKAPPEGVSGRTHGGGIWIYNNSSPTLKKLKVIANSAMHGGGIGAWTNSRPYLENIVLANNSGSWGGALGCWLGSDVRLMNVTITGNTGYMGDGIYTHDSHPKVTNSILWNNSPEEVYFFTSTSSVTITNSVVQGSKSGLVGGGTINWLNGNIEVNPQFVGNGDYHLSSNSPVLGQGTLSGAPTNDVEGLLRPAPVGSNPDMGAYEMGPSATNACTSWNVAKDFRMSPNQENPNQDSCGNKDVWQFMQSGDMNRNPQTYTLMPNFSTNSRYDGTAGIHNWTGTEIPDVTVWKTEKDFIRPSDTQLSKYVYMHPGWNHLTVVGWRSPINGNVKVNGEIASAYTKGGGGCGSLTGDGIKWYIDKGATNLVAGAFPNQGSQNLQEGTVGNTLANILVKQGDFLYFIIDRNANAFCDATKLDVTITQNVVACNPTLSVTPPYRALPRYPTSTWFDVKSTPCQTNWKATSSASWLSLINPTGTTDTTLKVTASENRRSQRVSSVKVVPTTGSPKYVTVIQKGRLWWYLPTPVKTLSGTIQLSQIIPQFVTVTTLGPVLFKITWPGSDLDLVITTPSGKTLTSSSPEVTDYYEGDTEEYYLVDSGEQGEWKVEVVGVDVDPAGEPYELTVIANERTQPPTEDTDNNGLPDEWEENFFGDLSQDGQSDADNDGLTNLEELKSELDPSNTDTDGDGILDKAEVVSYYTASGTLTDKNGQPMADVTIQIGDQTVITDANGYWEIPNLSEGNYVVTVSKAGYGTISQTIEIGKDQPAEIKFILSSLIEVNTTYTVKEVGQGNHITYTITITNKGSEVATGLIFTDTLPKEVKLLTIKADSSGKDCEKKTASCELPDLAPNASIQVELVVQNKLGKEPANYAQVNSDNYPVAFDSIPPDLLDEEPAVVEPLPAGEALPVTPAVPVDTTVVTPTTPAVTPPAVVTTPTSPDPESGGKPVVPVVENPPVTSDTTISPTT
ncbi:MAG: hypothetical protein BWK78_04830, partial [Thiotrichaceae bacterium IS1]